MTAELLREAAAKMRERAEAATRGPWSRTEYQARWQIDNGNVPIAEVVGAFNRPEVRADAEYIASWHPAVALAVADWLEAIAQRFPARLRDFEEHLLDREQSAALAVARAYLDQQAYGYESAARIARAGGEGE